MTIEGLLLVADLLLAGPHPAATIEAEIAALAAAGETEIGLGRQGALVVQGTSFGDAIALPPGCTYVLGQVVDGLWRVGDDTLVTGSGPFGDPGQPNLRRADLDARPAALFEVGQTGEPRTRVRFERLTTVIDEGARGLSARPYGIIEGTACAVVGCWHQSFVRERFAQPGGGSSGQTFCVGTAVDGLEISGCIATIEPVCIEDFCNFADGRGVVVSGNRLSGYEAFASLSGGDGLTVTGNRGAVARVILLKAAWLQPPPATIRNVIAADNHIVDPDGLVWRNVLEMRARTGGLIEGVQVLRTRIEARPGHPATNMVSAQAEGGEIRDVLVQDVWLRSPAELARIASKRGDGSALRIELDDWRVHAAVGQLLDVQGADVTSRRLAIYAPAKPRATSRMDRRPQEFPGGEPDGVSDNRAAIQLAIARTGKTEQLVLEGDFRIAAPLVAGKAIRIVGDGRIQALPGFAGGDTLLRITADEVVIDGDGLELDQADAIVSGKSIAVVGAAGTLLRGLVSRGTQRAFLWLETGATDLLLQDLDHLGKGYGVLSQSSASGIAGLVIADCRFEHPGVGAAGDGVEINTPDFGATDVAVLGCTATGYVGQALNAGIGFGFARVTGVRLAGCKAISCEGDGYHLENGSDDASAYDCLAQLCGLDAAGGSNGNGFLVLDSERFTGALLGADRCARHGVALICRRTDLRTAGSRLIRLGVRLSGWDGVHLTGQEGARVDACAVRDPSRVADGLYAGVHLANQGNVLENRNCAGSGNVVTLTGATTALGQIVVRSAAIGCDVDGIAGNGTDPPPGGVPSPALIAALGAEGFRGGDPWGNDFTFWSDGTGWRAR